VTAPAALESSSGTAPLGRRVGAVVAVATARMLATRSPRRIRAVLMLLRTGARAASATQILASRDAVLGVSPRWSGEHCLQLSIATVILCRLQGRWPTWCVGVRTDPFAAHAWTEADGQPVGEPFAAGHYHSMLTVPPAPPADGQS
jgi:hypothetical protein